MIRGLMDMPFKDEFVIAKTLLPGLLLLTMTGCQWLESLRTPRIEAPIVFQEQPTQQQLIQSINRNSAGVRQLSAKVNVAMDGAPRISGDLMVEKPRRMSLTAGALNMSSLGIEVGSNDHEFWIWNKVAIGGQTPMIYYASHQDFANSPARRSIPLEPQWIIDALGMVELNPNDQYRGPTLRSDGNYELIQTTSNGERSTSKVLVVDPKYGWIRQQTIYDSRGKRLAYVNAVKHQYFAEQQASLPKRIEIHVFDVNDQETTVTVDLNNISLNQLYGDANQLWRMPSPQDVPKVDISKIDLSAQPMPTLSMEGGETNQTRFGRNRFGARSLRRNPWR